MFRDGSHFARMAEVLPPEGELVTDLDKLVHIMGQVALAAPDIGLPQFRYGFRGYQHVSETVVAALNNGAFEHPDKMERTMPVFAERAFAPMRHFINGETDKIGGWSPMFFDPRAQEALSSTSMADFLSVHVNYDLPYTLLDTDTREEHRGDYTQEINLILREAGRQLMPEYVKVHPPLERLRVPDMALRLVLASLFKARDNAWKSFERLQAADKLPEPLQAIARAQIETDLTRQAAKRMLSTNRVADFVIRRVSQPHHGTWELPEAV